MGLLKVCRSLIKRFTDLCASLIVGQNSQVLAAYCSPCNLTNSNHLLEIQGPCGQRQSFRGIPPNSMADAQPHLTHLWSSLRYTELLTLILENVLDDCLNFCFDGIFRIGLCNVICPSPLWFCSLLHSI